MEEELLFFDELTKIYNRKGFFTYTALLLKEHPGIDFCLIYWNIQQFKVLNNLFGLQTGDQILIHIADILHNEFSDQIATYGRLEADNFICCVPKQVIDAGDWKDLLDISFSISGSPCNFCIYFKSISNSIGQWSDPMISVWIAAPCSFSFKDGEVIK